ncbi:MAG: hypothetical protein ACTHN0_17320 [Aquihabitans sp.]
MHDDHRTNRTLRVHAPRLLAVGLISLIALTGLTSCKTSVSWKLGRTHGAVIEKTAARASLAIYRKPRSLLYQLYRNGGTKAAQDAIWQFGQPPVASIYVNGIGFSTQVLNQKMHGYIYGDAADFRGALLDAQDNHDCLALTLISRGAYIKNWTHKAVGCQMGSL